MEETWELGSTVEHCGEQWKIIYVETKMESDGECVWSGDDHVFTLENVDTQEVKKVW
jgi:hypothetical protein